MKNQSMLKTGLIGTVVMAICCFTPALVVVLGVLGFSAIVGMLDIVLLPALVIFMCIAGYALWNRKKSTSA